MPMIFGILLLMGFGAAIDRAWEHAKADYRSSRAKAVKAREKQAGKSPLPKPDKRAVHRRHMQGYWGREIGGGFPVLRTGFHEGWLAHQAASAQAKGRREEERLKSLKQRHAFATALGTYRAEREQLEAEIAAAVAASPPERPTLAAVRERAGAVVLPFRPRQAATPAESPAGEDAAPEPGPYAPKPCAACGHPGTDDDPLVGAEGASWPIHYSHVTDPESGFYGAATNDCTLCGKPLGLRSHDGWSHSDCENVVSDADAAAQVADNRDLDVIEADLREQGRCSHQIQPGGFSYSALYCGQDVIDTEDPPGPGEPPHRPVLYCPEHQAEADGDEDGAADERQARTRALLEQRYSSPSTEGAAPMSETGYRQDVAACQSNAAHSEQGAADFRNMALAVEAMADGMGGAEMDSATLAEAMDLAERYRAAAAAADACAEGSVSFGSSLQARHEGLAEAHENAPVDHAATRDYYENA